MPSSVTITDSIIVAVSQLVDDSQADRRDPSHSDLEFHIRRHGLTGGDPNAHGQTVGKAKRVRAVLGWAMENAPDQGGLFVASLIGVIRGHGGFRSTSTNFVGEQVISNCIAALAAEGFELEPDGGLRSQVLGSLSGVALTEALEAYVRRAKLGSEDAALLAGTGKDLLEAVAAHVIQTKFGAYPSSANFPTLLGQAFVALGLATPLDPVLPSEDPTRAFQRAMFELGCSVNRLRNKQGAGHGRPWLPSLTKSDARIAVESIGVIAELLMSRLR